MHPFTLHASARLLALTLLSLLLLTACGDDGSSEGATSSNTTASNTTASNTTASNTTASNTTASNTTASNTTATPSLCVGVRGNGQLIFEHFAAMARIHEHYGLIDGVAGGSSASITSFLTESIYLNPQVTDCGGAPCAPEESAARVALMFKTLLGYLAILSQTEEALAFQQLAPIVEEAISQGIGDLVANGDIDEAREALRALFGSEDLVELVNPELLSLLADSPDPFFHIRDLWSAISTFGSFAADSDLIFLRPGLVNFEAFAEKIGRIGTFYAAYGPADAAAWEAFLANCATASRGMGWPEASQLDAGDGLTCGDRYGALLLTWRDAFLADEDNFDSRIDDPIGAHLSAIISTSVLTGDAVDQFKQAREDYLAAEEHSLAIDFEDVRFGYWGTQEDLDAVAANASGFDDAKTDKFLSLGPATWRTALSFSPAEPGLTRALEINDAQVSAGGWSDLAPSLVLKNLGCDKVILVTRQGDVRGFGTNVAGLLGMDDAGYDALYDLEDAASGVGLSIAEADGRWCTDWNNVPGLDFAAAFDDGYSAPMETTDPFFSTDAAAPYGNLSDDLQLPACSPGVGAE